MLSASAKIPAFLLVLMFLASVMAIPSNIALAQQTETAEEDEFKARADILLSILENVKERIGKTFEELEEKNVTIPEEAKTSYEKGLSIAEEAVKLRGEGKYREACEKAVEAMRSFKNVLVAIHKAKLPIETPKAEVEARKAIGLRVAVERAKIYADKLEKLVAGAEERGLKVSAEIKEKISEARSILDEALRLLDEGKVDEAARKLGDARKLLGECMAEYRKTVAQQIKLKMTEKFLNKTEERIEKLKEKTLPILEKLPEEKREKVEALIANATKKVEEAKEKVKQGIRELPKIMPILREIAKTIHESRKETGEKRLEKMEVLIEARRLQAQIFRLNARIKLLEKFGADTTDIKETLNETRNLLEAVKAYIDQNNLEKSKETIEKAKETVDKIDEQTFEVLKDVKKGRASEVMEKLKAKASEELEELQEKLGEIEAKIAELKAENITVTKLEQILTKAKEMLKQAKEKVESGNFTTTCSVVCPVKAIIYRLEKSLEWIEKTAEKARERWVPYTPSSENVEVNIRQKASLTIVEVTITFPHAGFRVDWGDVERKGATFTVDVKVEEWTGFSAQVVTRKTHAYRLGELEPGVYTFVFKANGEILVIQQFEVKKSSTPPLKPKIIDILKNPEAYEGKTVTIMGVYCGWSYPKGLLGPESKTPPVTRSDWIIRDSSGWIYVTGKLPDLDPIKDVGHSVTVKATVEVKVAVTIQGEEVTMAYLKAIEIET